MSDPGAVKTNETRGGIAYCDVVELDGRRWWVSGWVEAHDDGPHHWLFSMDRDCRNRVAPASALTKVGTAPGPSPRRSGR